ncbi:NAD(P)/FAD-dependent oxidoreductase [Lentzea alba]|uniref:NAD(P)/FAD-dependent oxidoreductase n=1 Tax=Lentzea alba TaxID=2714351 RepID=UPI0028BE918D|nr:NAD(P)/FAD-dependent oxidoreductase [Lentzea alba]
MNTHVIVGAGLAGAKTAEALRTKGFAGRIVLVGDEPHRPYERPPLSKNVLIGKAAADSAYIHDESWYTAHEVDLRLGVPVARIDRGAHRVDLADGTQISYDKLLLATGARPRTLRVPGATAEGVHHLRRIEDSQRLRETFVPGSRLVVVGAGWIGLEATAAARQAGVEVTVLESAELPLLKALGPEVTPVFVDLHRQHGVDLQFGVSVHELTAAEGKVTSVRLVDGAVVPADAVLVGVGAIPNTYLAEKSGLAVDNGILVDASPIRTSSRPVTSRTPGSRRWVTGSGSSTGPTRSSSPPSPPPECWVSTPSTTSCPTSTPTSTTWAWSTSATPLTTTRSCSAVTSPAGSSSPSGSRATWWWRT